MGSESTLEEAREAFGRQEWSTAQSAYAQIGDEAALALDDIERYAFATHLLGDGEACREILARGYRESLRREDVGRAVRFAFWIGDGLMFSGDMAQAGGWFARARSLLSERGVDCVEWGYLLTPTGVEQLDAGDPTSARGTFTEAQAIARRFADADLLAIAGHGLGRALIRLGLTGEGMAALDEVMVAVTSGEASPMVAGDVYCGVLEACHEVFDMRRAREWTAALTRWCEGQPELVRYRGPCLIHRVEVMRLHGDWEDAIREARRACDWLSSPASPEGPADAFYQLAELHRLRGDFAAAEEAYRQASRLGRAPEPGCALLWLARGQGTAAETAVRRALGETSPENRTRRAELLSAHVEILLGLGDSASAEKDALELAGLADAVDALLLHALADRTTGSVALAAGDARGALAPLRRAWTAWRQLDAPYEAARTRVLIGKACRALADEESAAMEFDAARWVFQQLGASHDLELLRREFDVGAPPIGGLTPREVEVLGLIAAGETNKAIAAALVISEHTVARHVQNMLQKLGCSSRTGLAAFAVAEGLARRPSSQD